MLTSFYLYIILMIALLIILLSIVQNSQTTFTYEVPVRQVQSFAFSDDLNYLVVAQGFRMDYINSVTTFISVPLLLLKKKMKEYQLIGKESYKIESNYPNSVVGKISMDDQGKVFIMANNDKILRVYKTIKNTFIQCQNIGIPTPYYGSYNSPYQDIYSYEISGDGKTIILESKDIIYVYKSNKDGFFQQFSQIYKTFSKWHYTQDQIYSYHPNDTGKLVIYRPILNLNMTESAFISFPRNIGNSSETVNNFLISKHQSQNQLTIVLHIQLKSKQNELRILSLNLQTQTITYKYSITTSSGNLLVYLTKNGKYLAYSFRETLRMMVYSLGKDKLQFHNKYWNFTKPSGNIFVSQDGKFAATSNYEGLSSIYGMITEDRKILEPLLLFEMCSIDNCFKCDLPNTICYECNVDYVLSKGRCDTLKEQNIQEKSPLDSELTNIIYVTPDEDQGLTNQRIAQQQDLQKKQILQKSKQQLFLQHLIQALSAIFIICCSFTKFGKYLQRKKDNKIKPNEEKFEESVIGTEISADFNNVVDIRQTQ